MSKFSLLLAGLFIEVIVLIGYLKSTSLFSFIWSVCFFGAIFSAGIIFILTYTLKKLGKASAFGLSITLAFSLVVTYQVLAFSLYPGLAKDMELFSREHVIQIVVLLSASLALHSLLYVAVHCIQNICSHPKNP